MTRIQPRRGTSAEWAAANPVLAEGELGFETDTQRSKRGDGATPWNDLPFDGVSYLVRFVDQNGDPLPPGSLTTIHVNTVTGDIDDITFEEA